MGGSGRRGSAELRASRSVRLVREFGQKEVQSCGDGVAARQRRADVRRGQALQDEDYVLGGRLQAGWDARPHVGLEIDHRRGGHWRVLDMELNVQAELQLGSVDVHRHLGVQLVLRNLRVPFNQSPGADRRPRGNDDVLRDAALFARIDRAQRGLPRSSERLLENNFACFEHDFEAVGISHQRSSSRSDGSTGNHAGCFFIRSRTLSTGSSRCPCRS